MHFLPKNVLYVQLLYEIFASFDVFHFSFFLVIPKCKTVNGGGVDLMVFSLFRAGQTK